MSTKIFALLLAVVLASGAHSEYEQHVVPRVHQQMQRVDVLLTPTLNADDYGD